ncbi:5'-AMP-activated protein kinase subunit gamma-2 [Fasciola gigantica]|uniref:5'-AMP-activated protein kinase subunit gamma-2 n=1 Tax=Fasciola gigantica TaxID=46835 RepID=A0A504YDS3_FASGI|nr:5'-AMP-activated protein kinase subunit gamma-2 [Fasciola gigantica]
MWSSRNVPSQPHSDSRDDEGMKELNGPSGLGVGKTTSTGSSTLPRNVPPYPNVPRGSTDKSRDTLDSNVHNSEPRNSVTVHSRFKQFWVESFVSGRCRTKSENQSGIAPHLQGDSSRVRSPVTELESTTIPRKDVLPPHAHTITGGSSQATSLLRRLAQYTNMSTPPSDQMSIKSGTDSLKRTTHGRRGLLGHTSGVSSAGGRSGSVPIPPTHSLFVQGQHRRQKSPRAVIGRLVSGSGLYGKSTEDVLLSLDLPDPSKLPREEPCSSLEFTQARLKNPKKIPQKLKVRSGFDVHRRKRAGSLSGGDRHSLTGTVSPQARPFLLEHLSKSEETLISGNQAAAILFPSNSVSTRQSGLQGPDAIGTTVKPPAKQIPNHSQRQHHQQQQQQQQHHHHHHHHHRHGNHVHHRSRGHLNHHDHHGIRATHTMTRVTESRRYLMFTRSLPFWSAKHYLETHGTGMGDSETYSVLFRHTECYELMPESAKLIILDSQLTISKAFRALIYNGIRAAPVWNSDTQTISTMLTVTDFVQMLNLCWHGTDGDRMGQKPILQMSDFDRITIQKWKELINIDPLVRSKSSSFAPVVINKREGGSSCANDDPKISGTKLQPLPTSSSHAFSHDPCITISCPTSNVSSPSRSRSSSSGSRSSASSLPPDLLTAQKLCRHSSVDQPSVLERSSTVTTQSQLNSDTGTVITPIRRASLGAPVQHSTSSGLPSRTSRLFFVHPEDSLLKALRLLSRFRLHHLPVIDPPRERSGNVLFVLTKRRLLSYLFSKMSLVPQPRFMQSSLADLNVGTFQCISMITLSTKLSETLLLFRNGRISALPVVDSLEKRRLINLFSKYDVITLVVSGAYNNPDLTVGGLLRSISGKTSLNEDQRTPPPVETCLASNSLLYVAEKLEKTGFRRLVIVNNTTEYRVEGIISLSDVLRFIVIQQARSGTNIHGPPPPPSVAEEPDEVTDEALKPPKPRQRTIKFELSPAHESDNEEKTLYTVRREDNVTMGTR